MRVRNHLLHEIIQEYEMTYRNVDIFSLELHRLLTMASLEQEYSQRTTEARSPSAMAVFQNKFLVGFTRVRFIVSVWF